MRNILIHYLIIINIITFIVFGMDKFLAKKNKRRISEKTLFLLSFIGGSFLEFIGMFIFRHKIKKLNFYIFNLLFIFIYVYILIFL